MLPYYKYLCKQPYEFYESEDVETLRMFTQIKEIQEDSPIVEKNDTREKCEGGERN